MYYQRIKRARYRCDAVGDVMEIEIEPMGCVRQVCINGWVGEKPNGDLKSFTTEAEAREWVWGEDEQQTGGRDGN